MKVFLEFVCNELLGPPEYGRRWRCPACKPEGGSGTRGIHDGRRPTRRDHKKPWACFTVLPPKKKPGGKGSYPIRWYCHRCKRLGDEYDLLRILDPDMSYTKRIAEVLRLDALWKLGESVASALGEEAKPKRKAPRPKLNPDGTEYRRPRLAPLGRRDLRPPFVALRLPRHRGLLGAGRAFLSVLQVAAAIQFARLPCRWPRAGARQRRPRPDRIMAHAPTQETAPNAPAGRDVARNRRVPGPEQRHRRPGAE
jgi:hypothetical protein